MMYMLISPRQCTESVCISQMEMVANDLRDTAMTVRDMLGSIHDSKKKSCDIGDAKYDCCLNLPPEEEAGCIFRVGQDMDCGCFARSIYAGRTSWLNKPEYDDWKYCINDGRIVSYMRDAFNDISNKDILARNLFLSFNDTDHLVYPARKIDKLFVPVPFMNQLHLGSQCMTIDPGHNISQLCLDDYDPVIQPFFTAVLEKKELNFMMVYDMNPFPQPEVIGNKTQFDVLKIVLEDILVANDLVLPVPYYKETVVPPKRIYHLSPDNKHKIYDVLNSHIENKQCSENVNMQKILLASHGISNSKGIFPKACQVVFVHSSISDKYKDVIKKVGKIVPSIFILLGIPESEKSDFWNQFCYDIRNGSYVQMHEYNRWDHSYVSGCVFIDDSASFSRENVTSQLNVFFDSYKIIPHSLYGDNGKIFVMPFTDVVEQQEVISVTIPIATVEGSYIVFGMNIDWNQMKSYYCGDETNLYPIMWRLEDVGVYITATINSIILLVYVGYILYICTFPFLEKMVRSSSETTHSSCLTSCGDVMNFCFNLNHIWLVIVMELLVAVMIPSFVVNIITVMVIFLILCMSYIFLCLCGVCGLQLKIYSVKSLRKKRKSLKDYDSIDSNQEEEEEEEEEEEKEEEELNQMKYSKKIEMKGMKMLIERIEFDSFIKGSFRNIEIASGKVTAIIGHSGAGKSTFFNILMGIHNPKSMKVMLSSPSHSVVVNSLEEISQYVGLVPQEEILTQRLTVFEQLVVQAKSKYTKQGSDMISYWARQLGMDGALYSKFPGQLSGGQAKRLSCLRELVGISPIILLDEPTSGLDGKSAEELIRNLSHLAKSQGLAIVVILHQPSTAILSYFDHLYIFLKDKETVDCAEIPLEGCTADHLDEFLKEPEKYLQNRKMEILPKKELLNSKYAKENKKKLVFYELFNGIRKRRVWCITKLLYIFYASCLEALRDTQGAMIDVLVISASAVALIAIFNPIHPFQGRSRTEIELCLQQACGDVERESLSCSSSAVMQNCSFPKYNPLYLQIFMTMFSVGLVSLITSLRLFGEEKKNMRRLFRSGVSFFHYYVSRLCVHVPRMLLSVYLFLSLVYNSTCLSAPFWYYYIICMLLYILVTGQGIVCSLLFPNKEKAVESTLLGMICISSSLLFSGIIVTENQISDDSVKRGFYSLFSFFKFFSYAFYGNEFLYVREILMYRDITPLSVRESIDMYGYSQRIGPLIGHGVVIVTEIVLWYLLGLGMLYFGYTQNPWANFRGFGNWCLGCCKGCKKTISRDKNYANSSRTEGSGYLINDFALGMENEEEEEFKKKEEGLIDLSKPILPQKEEEEDLDLCKVMIYSRSSTSGGEEEEGEEEKRGSGDLLLSRHLPVIRGESFEKRFRRRNDNYPKEEEEEEEEEIVVQENKDRFKEIIDFPEDPSQMNLTKEEIDIIERKIIVDRLEDEEETGELDFSITQKSVNVFNEVDIDIDDEDEEEETIQVQLLNSYDTNERFDELDQFEKEISGRMFDAHHIPDGSESIN